MENATPLQLPCTLSHYWKKDGLQAERSDHVNRSFQEILDFLESGNIKLEDVVVRYDKDLQRWILASPELREGWDKYHRENATLQWVSKVGNRKKSDSGYRKRKAQKRLEDEEREYNKKQRDLREDSMYYAEMKIRENIFG
jgi:hypothetical protein